MRLYTLFKAPPENVLEWDMRDIHGQYRWIIRLWVTVKNLVEICEKTPQLKKGVEGEKDLLKKIHEAIKIVTFSFETSHSFNVAIANLMKLSNFLGDFPHKDSEVYYLGVRSMLIMLAPMAPHVSSELWSHMIQVGPVVSNDWAGKHNQTNVLLQPWPKVNEKVLSQESKVVGVIV